MEWYTNPDWWSAIGQWVGGIGTVIAVWIALKQVNETRKLQYELMHPEIDVNYQLPITVLYWEELNNSLEKGDNLRRFIFDKEINKKLRITISNPKQTPVIISEAKLKVLYPVRENLIKNLRYALRGNTIRRNLRIIYNYMSSYIKFGNIKLRELKKVEEKHEIHTLLNPGEEYTFHIYLNRFKEYVLSKNLIMICLYIRYTNFRIKDLYIIITHPDVEVDNNKITIIENGKRAYDIFYQSIKKCISINKELVEQDIGPFVWNRR